MCACACVHFSVHRGTKHAEYLAQSFLRQERLFRAPELNCEKDSLRLQSQRD